MFDLPHPTSEVSILLTTGLGKIYTIMRDPAFDAKTKLETIYEFDDAVDHNISVLSSAECSKFREIIRMVHWCWFAMHCYGFGFDQSIDYFQSGQWQYN